MQVVTTATDKNEDLSDFGSEGEISPPHQWEMPVFVGVRYVC